MPLKTAKDVLPKSLQEVKASLLGQNKEITAETVGALDKASRKRCMNALNDRLKLQFPKKSEEFQQVTDYESKSAWLASFILDPESGGSVAYNDTSRSSEDVTRVRELWLTLDQYSRTEVELVSPRVPLRPLVLMILDIFEFIYTMTRSL